MTKKKKQERPDWYSSSYRGYYDFDKGKVIITHKKPLRCPYCGFTMNFASPIFYQYSKNSWYWFCMKCNMRLPNKASFSKRKLDSARKRWREHLKTEMKEAKEKYLRLKNLYNQYGRYYTPKEKRERLIESIEEQVPTSSIE